MREYKRISEIISFSENDKMVLQKIYDQKEALKKEVRQIELDIFRGTITDNGKKDSIKVAINYLEELFVSIINKYTSKMSEQEKENYINDISDNFFAQVEERQRNLDIALSQAYEHRIEETKKLRAKNLDQKIYEEELAKIDQEFTNKEKEIDFEKKNTYNCVIGPKYNSISGCQDNNDNQDDIQIQILKDQLFLEYLKYIREDKNRIMEIKESIKQIYEYITVSQNSVDWDIKDANTDCSFALYVCELYGINNSKNYDEKLSLVTKAIETLDYFATVILTSQEFTYLQPSEIEVLSKLYSEIKSEKIRKL